MYRFAWLLPVICAFVATAPSTFAADDDIAIAIVYDTSGSMTGQVKDAEGKLSPKFVVGNRALENIVAQIEKFAATSPKKIQAGLFTFALRGGKEVVPVGPFDPAKFRNWIKEYKKPDGGTPLGTAASEAAKALQSRPAGARHVLVITDGENTIGPPPQKLIPAINEEGMKSGKLVAFHFIAFDVKASVFEAIKKEGATLLSAADEKQLNERLNFLLEDKILLEKE